MNPLTKAEQFAKDAKSAGWAADYKKDGSRETVTAFSEKHHATIVMVWELNTRCKNDVYKQSFLEIDGNTRVVRNNTQACRMLAGQDLIVDPPSRKRSVVPKTTAKAVAEPVGKRKQEADLADDPPQESWEDRMRRLQKKLPFKISSPSEDIRKAVIGKEIVWINSKTRQPESARLLKDPNQRQLKVEYTAQKRRVLTFAANGQGFRSIHIDAIISVKG